VPVPSFPEHFDLQEDHLEMEQLKDRHGVCIITDEQLETVELFFAAQPQLTHTSTEGSKRGSLRFYFTPALTIEQADDLEDWLGGTQEQERES